MPIPAAVVRALRRHGVRGDLHLEPLAGDVGQRRYFRPPGDGDGPPALVVLYPPSLVAAWRRFRMTGVMLGAVGVRVPRVLDAGEAEDPGEGGDGDTVGSWMLVEDLGPRTLWQVHGPAGNGKGGAHDVRSGSQLAGLFHRAVDLLAPIQSLPYMAARALSPPLDRALLTRELEGLWETFLEPRGFDRDSGPGAILAEILAEICEAVAAEPPVVCHRDFMVRNLIPVEEAAGKLAVLDHQDLRPGPPLYDLASLLNDSLFPEPSLEEELLAAAGVSSEHHRDAYHRTAVQRTFKAVGTYARSGHHGELIAPTLKRALDHLARAPEGRSRKSHLHDLRQRLSDLLD